ncbi:SDR family NAD(P)-dependent oxidoreductase [Verrucomicrobiota bacterium]
MTKQSLLDTAITIRMTCSNPDITGKPGEPLVIVSLDDSKQAVKLSSSFEAMAEKVGLKPILYFSEMPDAQTLTNAITSVAHETDNVPKSIAVKNEGIFAVGRSGSEAKHIMDSLLKEKQYKDESDEHESCFRLPGCVAVITGSAQGFGKGIAEELVMRGCCVVIADLIDELGREFAETLNKEYGDSTAIFCHTDVTDSASLEACVAEAINAFGGVDMFVANAGVLKAGSLEEMDEKSFDLVTSVNYKGYYLCAKSVAPIMKLQHKINPHHFMDIIQVNSKSGLQGSNKNFAYAGSKFGAIGLTQSFAMELAPYNIKVNAVCPGNYFEGPLWSDPEKGLFVQYLKAGKVPGAKTIEDVKNSYVSKVPMGRGCLPEDVAKAILYLHDQEYETGQAVPVTGGQVMLS